MSSKVSEFLKQLPWYSVKSGKEFGIGLNGIYNFKYNYPFGNIKPIYIPHRLTPKTTFSNIYKMASKDYHKLYKSKVLKPYHPLSRLVFEGIRIDKKNKVISFLVGS